MLNDDEFLSKWKVTHERGVVAYMFRSIFFPITILILINITLLLIKPPINTDNTRTIIIGVTISVSIIIITQVRHWGKAEKRYKSIMYSRK